MADYVVIALRYQELVLCAYEHPSEHVSRLKAAADDVLRAHRSQTNPRMAVTTGDWRFVCASEPEFVVCGAYPSSLPSEVCTDAQDQIIDLFRKHVESELGDSWREELPKITRAYQFVRFGEFHR
jgi:hypothetical protein